MQIQRVEGIQKDLEQAAYEEIAKKENCDMSRGRIAAAQTK